MRPDEWIRAFTDSRFCLVVRGDTPHSHALLRSVRVGCIPVIASNVYERYSPTFRSSIRLNDYAVVLDEERLLNDPAGTLLELQSISEAAVIRQKLPGLRFAQRIMLTDHPEGLFVQAFLHEANAEMQTERDVRLEEIWMRPRVFGRVGRWIPYE